VISPGAAAARAAAALAAVLGWAACAACDPQERRAASGPGGAGVVAPGNFLPEPGGAPSASARLGGRVEGPALLPPRPAHAEAPEAAALAVGGLAGVDVDDRWAPFLVAKVGGRPALLLLASRESPQRWRPHVAFYRLARALSAPIVPPTVARALPLRALLEASSEAAARWVAADAQIRPDGAVMAAVTLFPDGTTPRAARWSLEGARWTKLAEGPPEVADAQPQAERAAAEGFATMLVLDYVAGNIFRQRIDQAADGPLWLIHNKGAFTEHPEALAVERQLAAVRRLGRLPAPLAEALEQLDEGSLDALLRAGPYDDWLVQRRPVREALVRARAVASLVRARRAQ
jgi:hypothetical protein